MTEIPLFVFILAGGSGERFWPLSRMRTPKHLLKLVSNHTLLEETIRRVSKVVPPQQIFVLTNIAQIEECRAATSLIPAENMIAEPTKRDTAPAAALATAITRSRNPNAACILLPADAVIRDADAFCQQLIDATTVATHHDALITFSIAPTCPSIGFGYLYLGEEIERTSHGSLVLSVQRFVEKPDQATAETYVQSGQYGWNAGMFVWMPETFLNETRRLAPALAEFIEKFPSGNAEAYIMESFPKLPKISVDYAIMEKAQKVLAIQATFDWDDVGTWTALPSHLGVDATGNTLRGEVVVHASRNNIVLGNKRVIALCGVQDLVVVETADALLICHKDAVQDIKKLQQELPESVK